MDELSKYLLGNSLGILGFILTAIGFVVQNRRNAQKAPIEDNNMAISTSNSAAVAIKSYSDEIADLRKEMSDMRREHNIEMAEMQKQIDRLQCEIDAKDKLIEEWRIGIGRLLGQFKGRNITPVWQPVSIGTPPQEKRW